MTQKKTLNEIEASLPGIKSEKVKDHADALDKILAVKRVFTSKDGQEVLTTIKDNCSIALRRAILAAKRGDTIELMGYVLDYSANVDLISRLKDISLESEIRNQLDDAVKEAYEEI